MRIITDTDRTEALEPCVATIGCFDGVHRGHRYLINQVCKVAAEKGLHAAIVTFPVHPRQVMQTDYQPQLLSCLHQKTDLISQLHAAFHPGAVTPVGPGVHAASTGTLPHPGTCHRL